MQDVPSERDENFVSTGGLPPDDRVGELVAQAHARFAGDRQGEVSAVYPALARVAPDLFGVAIVDADGHLTEAGDTSHPFSIMSVSKPFVFALICDLIGPTGARERIGANATGHAFNSLAGIERQASGQTNPMVNSGAIATTSLTPGANADEMWRFLHEGLSRFAGRTLQINEEIYASASETNFRNRSIAWMLHGLGRLYCDPLLAVDLYTRC